MLLLILHLTTPKTLSETHPPPPWNAWSGVPEPANEKTLQRFVVTPRKSRLRNLDAARSVCSVSREIPLRGFRMPERTTAPSFVAPRFHYTPAQRPMYKLTRTETFSACHRLTASHLSPEENERLFGKCARRHGHNYTLEVTVCGPLDPACGMVLSVSELKRIIRERVLDDFDHASLEDDVTEFTAVSNGVGKSGRLSTAENVARIIWERLEPHLHHRLYKVKLRETDKNVVTYKGPTRRGAAGG